MEYTYRLREIHEVAKTFWQKAGSSTIFALHGPMGAGKTTLVHALCEALGVRDHVSSPSYSLINEYRYSRQGNNGKIYHMDLYRLNNEAEAIQAGIEDCLYSGAICLVEWPEKAPAIFPEGTVHVYLHILEGDRRQLKLSVH